MSLPLGIVDAAVITIAERLNLSEVATVDRKHFSVVRPRHVSAFRLLPEALGEHYALCPGTVRSLLRRIAYRDGQGLGVIAECPALPLPWRYAWVSISMSTPNADAWELAAFPGRLDVAAYLTADQLAAQYRVLVDVLLDAQEHGLTGVGRDELLAAVRDRIADATDAVTAERLTRPEAFDLDARMHALQDWKVVIRGQDKAKTEADFIRTRDRYQLTSEAADLHRWLRRKIDEDAVSTSAAAFAPAIVAQSWAQVRTTLQDMA